MSLVVGGYWIWRAISFKTFTFTFKALSRRFYKKRLTISTFVRRKKQCISVGAERMFIEPICQALTIARLTHSLYVAEVCLV